MKATIYFQHLSACPITGFEFYRQQSPEHKKKVRKLKKLKKKTQ